MNKIPKALFICGSTQHLILFKSIIEELDGWDSISYFVKDQSTSMSKISLKFNLKYNYIHNKNKDTIISILKQEKPNIIVTAHDQTPISKLFIENANSMSIPSLMVQDGLYNFNFKNETYLKKRILNRLKFLFNLPIKLVKFLITHDTLQNKISKIYFELFYGKKGKRTIYGQGKTSKIAVFGKSTKDFLVSIGVDPNKIEITGSPKFDNVYYLKKEPKHGTDAKKVYDILLLTQPFVEMGFWKSKQRKILIETIYEAINTDTNIKLTIKLHPFEKKENYIELLNNYLNVNVIKNASLPDVIDSSDLTITVNSTAGLESIILGKPLIIINLFDDETLSIYDEMDIPQINKKEEMEGTIKKFLYDKNKIQQLLNSYDKNLDDHVYLINGKASARIASLINEIVNNY